MLIKMEKFKLLICSQFFCAFRRKLDETMVELWRNLLKVEKSSWSFQSKMKTHSWQIEWKGRHCRSRWWPYTYKLSPKWLRQVFRWYPQKITKVLIELSLREKVRNNLASYSLYVFTDVHLLGRFFFLEWPVTVRCTPEGEMSSNCVSSRFSKCKHYSCKSSSGTTQVVFIITITVKDEHRSLNDKGRTENSFSNT